MSAKTLSVVTLSWNRRDDLAACLRSVRAQSVRPMETIVVDNASTDDTVAMLRRDFPEARVIELPRNVGIAGYNEGMKAARGDCVVLIDNDMTFGGTAWFSSTTT